MMASLIMVSVLRKPDDLSAYLQKSGFTKAEPDAQLQMQDGLYYLDQKKVEKEIVSGYLLHLRLPLMSITGIECYPLQPMMHTIVWGSELKKKSADSRVLYFDGFDTKEIGVSTLRASARSKHTDFRVIKNTLRTHQKCRAFLTVLRNAKTFLTSVRSVFDRKAYDVHSRTAHLFFEEQTIVQELTTIVDCLDCNFGKRRGSSTDLGYVLDNLRGKNERTRI